jgi:hypothetical protein
MAPEQLAGGDVDARSDQFAFCVTAWEALAGRRPFTGRTFAELRDAVLHGEPTGGDAIPARLRPILARGMARTADERWPDMPSLLRAIERAWHRPRRVAVGAIAAVAVAGLVTGGLLLRRGSATPPCIAADRALAAVWSPSIRARVADQLGTDAQATSVVAFFDRWRDRWTAADRAVCSKPAAPDFAARRACLDNVRDEVAIWRGAMDGLPLREARFIDYALYIAAPEICQVNPRAIAPTIPAGADPAPAIALRTEMIVASVKASTDHERVDFAPFLDRARALGSGVLVAEALLRQAEAQSLFATSYTEQGEACATSVRAAAAAERAGHDRYRAMALIQELQCDLLVEAPLADQLDLAGRLESTVDRLGDAAISDLAADQLWEVDEATGQWTKAIERLDRARDSAIARGSRSAMIDVTVHGAEVRRLRHLPGDLATAIDRLRQLWPAIHSAGGHEQRMLSVQLAPLLWMTGDIAGAVPYLKVHKPRPSEPVEVRIRVSGDGAAGAEVIAAADPNLDPLRLSMAEFDGPVASGTADAAGALTLQAPIGGVIVARAGPAIAVAAVPDRAGPVELRLAPGAVLHGTVTGFAAMATDDPAVVARAARREVPAIFATTTVAGRALTWHAPVAVVDGSWTLPPVPPGKYVIAADVTSALGDDQSAQAVVDVGAGAPPPPIALVLPTPAIARVIVHPAIAGRVAVVPAGTAPRTWAQATARLASATTLSMADIGEPLHQERLVPGAATGDAFADVSVLTPRPAVVCVLPELQSTFQRSLWRGIPGPDRTPPMCRELPVGDEPVVIDTR